MTQKSVSYKRELLIKEKEILLMDINRYKNEIYQLEHALKKFESKKIFRLWQKIHTFIKHI